MSNWHDRRYTDAHWDHVRDERKHYPRPSDKPKSEPVEIVPIAIPVVAEVVAVALLIGVAAIFGICAAGVSVMFEITAYNCQRMRATALGSNDRWSVDIEVTEQRRGRTDRSTVTVHFDCDKAERKANAYANAINMVDDQFYSIKTVLDRSVARENA